MPLSIEALAAALKVSQSRAAEFAGALSAAVDAYGIDSRARLAGFLAQIGHESERLTILEEPLDLPADRLPSLYPHAFKHPSQTRGYGRNPRALADRIYADRHGNGAEESGDGSRYLPRGLVRVWGRDEYARHGEALGLDLVASPELLATPEIAADAAAWRWRDRRCNRFCEADDFNGMTRVYVDVLRDMRERRALWAICKAALGVPPRDSF